jgi:hypothetical protein
MEYAYAGGDPVNRWDPSGLDDVRIDGDKAYWIFTDTSEKEIGRLPIGPAVDGDWVNIDGKNASIVSLAGQARDVHLAYEPIHGSVSSQMAVRQILSGTFYKGGFGGSQINDRGWYYNQGTVLADGLTFSTIDGLNQSANEVIAMKTKQYGKAGAYGWGFSRGAGKVAGGALVTALAAPVALGAADAAILGAARVAPGLTASALMAADSAAVIGTAKVGLGALAAGATIYTGAQTVSALNRGDYAAAGEGTALTLAAGSSLPGGVRTFASGITDIRGAILAGRAAERTLMIDAMNQYSVAARGKPMLRLDYEDEVRQLVALRDAARGAGSSAEATARLLHEQRRIIGMEYKLRTPEELRDVIYGRNLRVHGDELGPSIDFLRGKGKSWESIIQSSINPGGKDLF